MARQEVKSIRFGTERGYSERKHNIPTSEKPCTDYHYCSKSYPELIDLYNKWYGKERKKRVPMNLKLTPIMVRQWYIGDGYYRRKDNKPKSIEFATCSFSKEGINHLISELSRLGLKSYENNNRIYLRSNSLLSFFSLINNCPPEINSIYGYKWPSQYDVEILSWKQDMRNKYGPNYWSTKEYLESEDCKLD